MQKLTFFLYYVGTFGLMYSYFSKQILVDRASLILMMSGCIMHSMFWAKHIKENNQPVYSALKAFNNLRRQRDDMSIWVRMMPDIFGFYSPSDAIINKSDAKSNDADGKITSRSIVNFAKFSLFTALLISIPCLILTWKYGVGALYITKLYRVGTAFGDFGTLLFIWSVSFAVFTLMSVVFTGLFLRYKSH
jgi:hypothetical protein